MMTAPSARQPVLFITHGGGPCFWITFPPPFGPRAFEGLRAYFAGLLESLPERPRAILVISAHWEEAVPTVSLAAAPPMLFDYYGFPPETYRLSYPAPGSPELGREVVALLAQAGIAAGSDAERGFDHGVFVPFLIVDPAAQVPVVMLSLNHSLDPAAHLAIGAALAPLRDQGVLIVGSGSSYHDLRHFGDGQAEPSTAFDDWLTAAVTDPAPERRAASLVGWASAPGARACHPREEHLLPLMVAAGAAGGDAGRRVFHDRIANKAMSGYAFG